MSGYQDNLMIIEHSSRRQVIYLRHMLSPMEQILAYILLSPIQYRKSRLVLAIFSFILIQKIVLLVFPQPPLSFLLNHFIFSLFFLKCINLMPIFFSKQIIVIGIGKNRIALIFLFFLQKITDLSQILHYNIVSLLELLE